MEYNLNTLTYSTASTSFIARKCLAVIANSIAAEQPSLAKCIGNNFYMDDLSVGSETEEDLIQLKDSMHRVLAQCGFNLTVRIATL